MSKECTQVIIAATRENFQNVKVIRQQWSEVDKIWYPAKLKGQDHIVVDSEKPIVVDLFGYSRLIITETE